TAQPAESITPIGSVNKEVGPVGATTSEFVKPSETQPQIDQGLAELGVEARKDEPSITDEHKDFINHAGPHTPISSSPSGKVTMPMSEEEVGDMLKTGEDDDSGKWLAGLIRKIIAWGLKVR
ncbi:MAG: hypothetical protein Q8P29_04370, partial [Candidatus Levybacteria bacterium]|nr:hypothetical protein [Candidatus Levybacteria bacterium]